MLKKIVFIVLLNINLFGLDLEMPGFALHGNFCGKDNPKINAKSNEEEIIRLDKIMPIDIIDSACKEHDICYVSNPSKHDVCDDALVLHMKDMEKKFLDKNCRLLTKAIRLYFDTKNTNPITLWDGDYSNNDKIKEMPTVAAQNMFDMGSIGTDLAINFMYSKPTGYIFDSKNNSQRKKEILQALPPRYKACKF